MDTRWLKDTPTEQKEEMRKQLNATLPMFKKFIKILDELEKSYNQRERSLIAYDNPSWPEKQAHINGYLNCLAEVRNLLTTKD